MNTVLAYVPRMQFFDSDGNPLSSGRIQFFEAGTTTPKAVYTDKAGTISATEFLLDSGGFAPPGVWYGEGAYKMVTQELVDIVGPVWATIWTVDDIDGGAIPLVGQQRVLYIDKVIDLPYVDESLYDVVFCAGYYTVGDGGGGEFYWNGTSSLPQDGGVVISPDTLPAQGRWLRIVPPGNVPATYWGYLSQPVAVPMESRLGLAHTYCSSNKRVLLLQSSFYAIGHGTSITLDGGLIHIEDGFHIVRTSGAPSVIDFIIQNADLIIDGTKAITTDSLSMRFSASNCYLPEVHPTWWGGDNTGATDTYWPLLAAINTSLACGTAPVIIDGNYTVRGGGATPTMTLYNVHFTKDSYLTNYLFKIDIVGEVSCDGICEQVFRNVPGGETFFTWDTSTIPTKAWWFFKASNAITEDNLTSMCEQMTDFGTKINTLIWDTGLTYVMPTAVPNNTSMTRTKHVILACTKWDLPGSNLTAFQLYNDVIYPSWFKDRSLQMAIFLTSRNSAILDGELETINKPTGFFYDINYNANWTMRNLTVNGALNQGIFMSWYGFIRFINIKLFQCGFNEHLVDGDLCSFECIDCSFDGNSLVGSEFYTVKNDTNLSTYRNCYFANYENLLLAKGVNVMENCTINNGAVPCRVQGLSVDVSYTTSLGQFDVNCDVCNISYCKFNSLVQIVTWFYSGIPSALTYKSSRVNDNVCQNKLSFYNPRCLIVTNNSCIGMRLDSLAVSNFIVQNVLIKDNIINVVSPNFTYIQLGALIAATGHNASVYGNMTSVGSQSVTQKTRGVAWGSVDLAQGANSYIEMYPFLPNRADYAPTVIIVGLSSTRWNSSNTGKVPKWTFMYQDSLPPSYLPRPSIKFEGESEVDSQLISVYYDFGTEGNSDTLSSY